MPFLKLDITNQLLNTLSLPEQLDDKHPYHYWIFRHTDGDVMFIKRSYSHLHESFQDMELWIGADRFIIEEKILITEKDDSWDYLLTDLIAYIPPNYSNNRKQITDYMSEILETYERGQYRMRIADSVNLVLANLKGTMRCISLHKSA